MDEASATQLTRLQIAMWLPAKCAQCHKPYRDVDDFLARNPLAGQGFHKAKNMADAFVDEKCWDKYAKRRGLKSLAEFANA